ncbi:hypothetical protein [Spiroplasma clarkii]|uniref:Lipoprotein n=1 Tax=Spiroplasma clarkii TaxID=2139 RepID=A0A2K8KM10_9MOLU|nr:hypothetical protein [Spiroplasma clarkii]ATX71451.1 hypothetical protein SCLAR_v1c11510 [Spiroplasma clarkii]
MKKILASFSSIGFIAAGTSSVLACKPDTSELFFSNPDIKLELLAAIKQINYEEITTLKDLDSKIEAILEEAVKNNNVKHIIPGTISVRDYYYFYDDSRNNEVIRTIDEDKDGVNDFKTINYVIKVDFEEKDGFETDYEDELIYVYNTPIDANNQQVSEAFENSTRQTLVVEYEKYYSEQKLYQEVIEELSERLVVYINNNVNRVGFNGGFLNGVDVNLKIDQVTNGKSVVNRQKYAALLESGQGLSSQDPITVDLTFDLD